MHSAIIHNLTAKTLFACTPLLRFSSHLVTTKANFSLVYLYKVYVYTYIIYVSALKMTRRGSKHVAVEVLILKLLITLLCILLVLCCVNLLLLASHTTVFQSCLLNLNMTMSALTKELFK